MRTPCGRSRGTRYRRSDAVLSDSKQLGDHMGQCWPRLARRDIHCSTSMRLVGADRGDNLTMKLIDADTRTEAWMKAAEFLLCNGPSLNLVLGIHSPRNRGPYPTARRYIDEFLIREGKFSMHTVAETIFPGYEYRRLGLQGVFNVYPEEIYPKIKKHRNISWGTYAYRLVRRQKADGKDMNPLEQLIQKMKAERDASGPKKSCYELGIAEGEYDLPLYNTAEDGRRRMGGPCLSHLSFKLFNGAVHLAALYRSHDYSYKVPGNLLGLARLQECVACETEQQMGSLVVHSTYAYLSGSKTKIRELLTDIGETTGQKEASDVVAH